MRRESGGGIPTLPFALGEAGKHWPRINTARRSRNQNRHGVATASEAKRRSALISRKLRLLRAHGIVHKISGRNLYQVSPAGRALLNAFLIARQASMIQLMKAA